MIIDGFYIAFGSLLPPCRLVTAAAALLRREVLPMSPPEMANGNGPILKRGGAGFPTVSFPVVIISLAKKLISIPNGKAGMQSIEDQFGPYGDPVR